VIKRELGGGIETLEWTLSDRIGGRPLMAFELFLDAIAFGWMASVAAAAVLKLQAA
jgi:hypothetical protein